MARRLNAMLLQMQMMPKARMATKDQLTKIFVLEAEAMREEIDALDHAAKHSGMFRDPSQYEADRQVGWACPLFDAYGAKDELSFEEGGEARERLSTRAPKQTTFPSSQRPTVRTTGLAFGPRGFHPEPVPAGCTSSHGSGRPR
ncbi:MAG: hypothetical protein ACTHOP_09820 [Mesorhizobium sp.]